METPFKKTIMLADDEEDIRTVLGITLQDMGYRVIAAQNGKEALELFKKEKPTLVITDIKMPGMDGIEFLQKIKHENPDTEVIMITGHGDIDLAIKSLKYDAVDFITKPIDNDILEIAIKRANEKIITRFQLKEYTESLENLVREKSELKDRLSSLGLMIGSISHGIKGLLTRLDGGFYLIDSALKKKEYGRIDEGLNIIRLTAKRIKKMSFDILYYAKEREISKEPVNCLSFASDVSDTVESKFKGSKIQLVRDFAKAPMEVEIDFDFFRSALINILDNAVDACLSDTDKKDHKITFRIIEEKENIVFHVHDNGTGLGEEIKEKIFDLFFSTKKNKGTGFGLFIAANIIQQHGGLINVNSVKGKGTHFSISVPKPSSGSES